MTEQTLSAIDAKILAALQQDGRTTNQTLADAMASRMMLAMQIGAEVPTHTTSDK